jgi:uncharacterized protein (TIGR04551 family)
MIDRAWPVAALVLLWTARARATGFTDIGEDIVPRTEAEAHLDGYMRLRAYDYYDMDLNRGLTPSGQPLFPVPLGDPNAKSLTYADMRLRTDIAAYAPGATVAVKARVDVLDNVALGSNSEGVPTATTTALSPPGAFHVKRAYGEALTPIGLIAAGRIGSEWGLGMLTNGGDCADCDAGDAADRIALLTPLAGHIWAVAYDFSAIGPTVPRPDGVRSLDLEPGAAVHTITFAVLRYKDDFARARRRRAGKTTVEYGAYVSHRWQNDDVPATYLPTAQPIPITSSQVMPRGFQGTAVDGWGRITNPYFRVEAEWAVLTLSEDQASLIPGVLYRQPVTGTQFGGALESEAGPLDAPYGAGLDAGYASGDNSPGFGAFPQIGQAVPQPGDLNGPKANPPTKNTIDNFTFHPDYRVDRILFHEIIGTVTGAYYVRPHVRYDIVRAPYGVLQASLAAIASWAVFPLSTPGGKTPLGVELDPTLAYASKDGFGVSLEYALFLPGSGFDNPPQGLTAKPAQLGYARLMYRF